MTEKDFFYTIEKTASAEFKDRGSQFIAFTFPLSSKDEFKIHLATVKNEHPKATHYCFAYRLGLDGNNFRTRLVNAFALLDAHHPPNKGPIGFVR